MVKPNISKENLSEPIRRIDKNHKTLEAPLRTLSEAIFKVKPLKGNDTPTTNQSVKSHKQTHPITLG
jgi:hypothetical protein